MLAGVPGTLVGDLAVDPFGGFAFAFAAVADPVSSVAYAIEAGCARCTGISACCCRRWGS
ncbi:MAG: hypothetical protein WBP81_21060 [Solirubrobacteraceae bacterium]